MRLAMALGCGRLGSRPRGQRVRERLVPGEAAGAHAGDLDTRYMVASSKGSDGRLDIGFATRERPTPGLTITLFRRIGTGTRVSPGNDWLAAVLCSAGGGENGGGPNAQGFCVSPVRLPVDCLSGNARR
jgi:hypothetical protein